MYDVIVIGTGSMGSAACYFLAKRGYKVLGLDQFNVPHENGSHSGQTRIIRKAYFEHPDYVPLLETAYENWRSLESETGEKLIYPVGVAYIGDPGHELIEGVKKSALLYKIHVDEYNIDKFKEKFLPFQLNRHFNIIFEQEAGFIFPEKSIEMYVSEAVKFGAEIINGQRVQNWVPNGSQIQVTTDKDQFTAEKLILTSGAWTTKLLPDLASQLRVTEQWVAWFKPTRKELFTPERFPCWTLADEHHPGIFYGFPLMPGDDGIKVAHHAAGRTVDPDTVDNFSHEGEIEKLRQVIRKYIPDAVGEVISVKRCFYTYAPDDHFIIDLVPGYNQKVAVACGFSGHGFKFSPVVGEILADLAMKGKTDHPIEFLSLSRFNT